jgi:hypothetical protein
MPILLVEGTRGAGKTTLGTLLVKDAEQPEREHVPPGLTVRLVPQRLTLGLLGPLYELGMLDDDLATVLLGRLVDWVRRSEGPERWLVLDTVHLTMWVRGMLRPASFAGVDDALARLGTRGLLLRASEESIRARRVRDDETRITRWVSDQQTMLDLCGSSSIPWSIVEADLSPHTVLDSVAREVLTLES